MMLICTPLVNHGHSNFWSRENHELHNYVSVHPVFFCPLSGLSEVHSTAHTKHPILPRTCLTGELGLGM